MPKAAPSAEKSTARTRALAMLSKGISFAIIQKATGISLGTLSRLKNGATTVDTANGRPPVIPKIVEDSMAEKLRRLVAAHMSVDIAMFPLIAKDIARKFKLTTTGWKAGDKWVKGFLQRHPDLAKRKCGKISRARAIHFNVLTHTEWYEAMKPLLKLYLPEEVFNMDDTGLDIEHRLGIVRHAPPPHSLPKRAPHPKTHPFFSLLFTPLPFRVQVIGIRGGPQPKKVMTNKSGHIAATVTAPAKGPMMPILWTFSGKLNKKDMCEGTDGARWNKTANGWPDDETFLIWAGMVIEHKKQQGLKTMLIFIDNAAIHFNDEVAFAFAKEGIMLVGLIPSSTGHTQPLDRCHFGCVKPVLERLCKEAGDVLTETNVAKYYEAACKELGETARKAGKSILAAGFKLAGLVPFNPEATLAGTAAGDARIAPTPAKVERAKASGEAAGKLLVATVEEQVKAAFMGRLSEAALALEPLAAAAKAVRLAKYGAALDADDEDEGPAQGPALGVGLVARSAPTSKEFAERRKRELAEAEAEAAANARRKVEKAAKRDERVKEVEARKERAAERRENAARKKNALAEAKEQRRAAKRARMAPKVAAAAPAPQVGKKGGKRARPEEPNQYEKQYQQGRK